MHAVNGYLVLGASALGVALSILTVFSIQKNWNSTYCYTFGGGASFAWLLSLVLGCIWMNEAKEPSKKFQIFPDTALGRIDVFNETEICNTRGYYYSEGKKVLLNTEKMVQNTLRYKNADLTDTSLNSMTFTPYRTEFSVVEEDTYIAAKLMLEQERGANPVCLNMANQFNPGGGVKQGASAQEECLFRKSTLCVALKNENYPLDDFGGIYSPHVLVYRDEKEKGHAFLETPFEVAVVTLAAYRLEPNVNHVQAFKAVEGNAKEKIRRILRIAALKGHKNLILGAFGCGAFHNPPNEVAELFYQVFLEPEFKGRFYRVQFAIIAASKLNTSARKQGQANIIFFKQACEKLMLETSLVPI